MIYVGNNATTWVNLIQPMVVDDRSATVVSWFSFASGYLLASFLLFPVQSAEAIWVLTLIHPCGTLVSQASIRLICSLLIHHQSVDGTLNHILWSKFAPWTQSWLLHTPVLRNASSTTKILKLDWPGLLWWFTQCLWIWESSFLLERSSQWLLAHSHRLLSVSPT